MEGKESHPLFDLPVDAYSLWMENTRGTENCYSRTRRLS